jgi:hypothetical protein
MATARFPLALCVSLAAVTSGCGAKLPVSAETFLLRHLHAQKIIEIHDVRRRTIDGFDYLGLFATFEVESNFEKWYHPEVILRKKHSDPDWSHAEVFSSRQRIADLFALPNAQFEQALFPLLTYRPNQALERTADRRDNLLPMASTLRLEAQLAAVSGRSALSR